MGQRRSSWQNLENSIAPSSPVIIVPTYYLNTPEEVIAWCQGNAINPYTNQLSLHNKPPQNCCATISIYSQVHRSLDWLRQTAVGCRCAGKQGQSAEGAPPGATWGHFLLTAKDKNSQNNEQWCSQFFLRSRFKCCALSLCPHTICFSQSKSYSQVQHQWEREEYLPLS